MSSTRSNARCDNEEMLKKELEITKRMLDRTVKLKNKYKSDLDICMNENKLLKIRLEVMQRRVETDANMLNTMSTEDSKAPSITF